MNTEIERKYPVLDYSKSKEKVLSLPGIEHGGTKHGIDIYFVVPQKVEKTKYLRVRFANGAPEKEAELAYHEVVNNDTTNEWETKVSNGAIAQEIFLKLGFSVDVSVDKKRETYSNSEVEIVLDQVDGLGCFIEIEAPNVEILNKYEGGLGLDGVTPISGAGYPDLLRDALKTKK